MGGLIEPASSAQLVYWQGKVGLVTERHGKTEKMCSQGILHDMHIHKHNMIHNWRDLSIACWSSCYVT